MRRRPRDRNTSRARRGLRAGFTMIELMVVITVLGLVTTVVVVSYRRALPLAEFNKQIRTLHQTILGARSDAIARNAKFEIHYEIDEDRYWIRSPFQRGGGMAKTYEERMDLGEVILPDRIDIVEVVIDGKSWKDGEVYVFFTPLGGATEHYVILRDTVTEQEFTVEVVGLTGLIRLHDGYEIREQPREGAFD